MSSNKKQKKNPQLFSSSDEDSPFHKHSPNSNSLKTLIQTKDLNLQLDQKQKEISDLSNMLERSEDTFETILLDVLQKSEQLAPHLLCEQILMSVFNQRSVLDETGIDRFTKKRIIKEKLKNLKHFMCVLGLLNTGNAQSVDKCVGQENQKFKEAMEQIIRQGERFLNENKKGKLTEKFYFSLCENVHDFWTLTKEDKKFREMVDWKNQVHKSGI
jgi:hypothetical protein